MAPSDQTGRAQIDLISSEEMESRCDTKSPALLQSFHCLPELEWTDVCPLSDSKPVARDRMMKPNKVRSAAKLRQC